MVVIISLGLDNTNSLFECLSRNAYWASGILISYFDRTFCNSSRRALQLSSESIEISSFGVSLSVIVFYILWL